MLEPVSYVCILSRFKQSVVIVDKESDNLYIKGIVYFRIWWSLGTAVQYGSSVFADFIDQPISTSLALFPWPATPTGS